MRDASGTVLRVLRVEVLLEDLTVEGGVALRWTTHEGRHYAGGITNRGGTLMLRDVVVRRNRGKDAGGIYNTGTLSARRLDPGRSATLIGVAVPATVPEASPTRAP